MSVPAVKDQAAALSRRGVFHARKGHMGKAVAFFRKAIEIDPRCENAFRNLALALRKTGRREAAGNIAARGLEFAPDDAGLHAILAESLRHQKRVLEAVDHAERAMALSPGDADACANLAMLYADLGQWERVSEVSDRAIVLNPACAQAHRLLANARSYRDPGDPHITQMKGILKAGGLHVRARADLCFALAKALDDAGQYDEAFQFYKDGNRHIRSTFKFSIDTVARNFRQFKKAADVDFLSVDKSDFFDRPVPIFIIGMPRSGTSLVEQILASHPDVFGAGESEALASIQIGKKNLRSAHYAEDLSALSVSELQALAAAYYDLIGKGSPGNVRFITDKMPMNFRFVPLIRHLFPRAKIIHCRRDPRDTCISIFRAGFAANVPFASDLDETTAYYHEYRQLTDHFHAVYGDDLYVIQYEDFVEDIEGQTRRLLEFCGLGWSDACLEFFRNDRPVVTASSYQVRRPVYKNSIGRWRRYEESLKDYLFFSLHK